MNMEHVQSPSPSSQDENSENGDEIPCNSNLYMPDESFHPELRSMRIWSYLVQSVWYPTRVLKGYRLVKTASRKCYDSDSSFGECSFMDMMMQQDNGDNKPDLAHTFTVRKKSMWYIIRKIVNYECSYNTIKYITYVALFITGLLIVLHLPLGSYLKDFSKIKQNWTISKEKSSARTFYRSPETAHFDCIRVMHNDRAYIEILAERRITYSDPEDLTMECDDVHARNYFPQSPASSVEEAFPLAQARVVYKDYRLLEMELSAAYAPQNWYCYAIDSKADAKFHDRMHQLAKCLPNVLITTHEYRVDGGGKYMTSSYIECLKLLATKEKPRKKWRYVSLLQNHDISLRTNKEAVQIFKWMNGANDFEITFMPEGRVNQSLDWSFGTLHLFRNSTRNTEIVNGFPSKLVFSKGYVESSLSREFVEFILYQLDLTELLKRVENQGFGTDEIMFPTLHATDALQAPGGFTHACIDKGQQVQEMTRISLWYDGNRCLTHHMRHAICVFGIEDLPERLSSLPHLFANKLMPEFDFGAVNCWYESMFNRSHTKGSDISNFLNASLYKNLPNVRFQQFKAEAKSKGIKLDSAFLKTFNCMTI